jgi:NADH-quinone oxidoreductase subunit J
MSFVTIVLYFFVAIAALSALALALAKNVFYGALLLIVCLLALAGVYVLAFAEFVAVTQILIYAGGILVVIIFGIMLTTGSAQKPLSVSHTNVLAGLLTGIGCFGLLCYLIVNESFLTREGDSALASLNHTNNIGVALMTSYMLPFEVAGILLLMALVAAAVIASSAKHKS